MQEKVRKQSGGKESSLEDVARLLGLRSVVTVQQRLCNAATAKKLLQQYNVKLVISVARQHKDKWALLSFLLRDTFLQPLSELTFKLWKHLSFAVLIFISKDVSGLQACCMGCRGVEFSDLLPAGMAGLERAIERFDASKGFKFSTYAHWWIRQNVCRCVQVCPSFASVSSVDLQ